MNREFTFRVWDKKYKCWLKDNEYSLENNNHLSLYNCVNQFIDTFYCGADDSRFIIQQFTGLKDINGVDIYEGDFVELWTVANQKAPNMRGLYEIIWGRTGFDLKCHKTAAGDIWFQLQKDKSFENTDGSYFVPSKIVIDTLPLRCFNICKVVGNIFEDKKNDT